MNPPPPSLPYPQNPNSNPNPANFFYHLSPQNSNPNFPFHPPPQNPNQSFVAQAPPAPPAVRDLSETLSSLKNLVSLCNETLDSLSQTLSVDSQFLQKCKNVNLVRCPYNPHHLMPPESLFLHFLRCPPPLDLTYLLGSLNYPSTLKLSCESQQDPSGADLCFSLDGQADFMPSFFYKDCPGVVNLSDLDRENKGFTLPCVLSVECTDFVGSDEKELKSFNANGFRVSPSDFWATRDEVDAWRDYPCSYSFHVLYAVMGSKLVGESVLRKWIVANSPRYGVIIDTFMRDHIFLLFRLCLKAIVKEACGLVEFVVNNEDCKANEQRVHLKNRRFECPILVQVLAWFASQLAVLYGEGNGKFFAIHMVKQCVLESASRFLLFQSKDKMSETPESAELSKGLDSTSIQGQDGKVDERLESSTDGKSGRSLVDEDGEICISRVAAAVAALHERSLLETKIKELRFAQPLMRYQRNAEHDFLIKKADEERKRRPNYRPIIDHDGLPWQRPSNQGTNKTKTKEDLLAEERDYKRRRMSYRGKKLKRTPLQVLRDIIEAYTEEIKLAGGIGSFEKGAERETTLQSKTSPGDDRKEQCLDYNRTSMISEEASPKAYKQTHRDHHGDLGCFMESRRINDRKKHGKEYDSGSSQRRPSYGRSYEQDGDGRDRHDSELKTTKRPNLNIRSYNRDHRPSYHAKGSSDDNRMRNSYDNQSSGSRGRNAFDDRYDPERQ